MECENCGKSLPFPAMARLWVEYRVGDVDSRDQFYLCPSCEGEVDPIELWSNQATVEPIYL